MTARLFKRTAVLTLARYAPTTARGGKFGAFFQTQGNGIAIGGADASESLRFTFRIEKDLEPEPNYSDIVVYNMRADHRAEFQKKPVSVRLDVGYDGEAARIFTGNLRWSDTQREAGTTWVTTIQCGDGERAYSNARVNRSFRPGVDIGTGLREAAKAMELDIPDAMLSIIPGVDRQFAGGLTMTGPAHREMTRLLKPLGASWSVQDGKLQLLAGTAARPDAAILVGADGIPVIDRPEYGPPGKSGQGKPPTLTIKTLLFPGYACGGRIQVSTPGVSGVFKVQKLVHTGDTHGKDWYTTLEAIQR